MVVRVWEFDFEFDNGIFRIIYFWVKVLKFLLYMWFVDSLSIIVSVIGIFLYIDKFIV